MSFSFSLIPWPLRLPYLDLPQGWLGWAGWVALACLTGWLLWRWRGFNKPLRRRERLLLFGLAGAALLLSLLLPIRLPPGGGLPRPDIPEDQPGVAVLVFSSIPWVLAAGLLGPLPAAGLAFLTGLLRALWDTHNPFFPLEFALLATLFSAAANQRYRTRVYRFLRRPLVAALLLALVYPFISLADTIFTIQGILVSRLDYALTNLFSFALALLIELLVAGLAAEIIAFAVPERWGRPGPLIPSPAERSLQARFIYGIAPLALALILTLMAGDWIVAGNAARDMLEGRMANASQVAAENIPFFLESGQNLIEQLAEDPRLVETPPGELRPLLEQDLRSVPFFNQLYLINASSQALAGYPQSSYPGSQPSVDEQMGIQLALSGVPFQIFALPPQKENGAAQISFVAAVYDRQKVVQRILIGRSDLASNPLIQPVLTSLKSMAGEDGQGSLLDENGRILYSTQPVQALSTYSGNTGPGAQFYDAPAPNGARQLVYYQPAEGRPWAVVLMVPAHRAQALALRIASPLLWMIVVLSFLGIVVLRLALRVVTASLENLAVEAGRIAQGRLDSPLPVDGEDEVGQLRRAFEQMRASLKARLDELNRLLQVSQGVASSLEVREAAQPVLESALATGACAARLVLSPAMIPNLDGDQAAPVAFGMGPASELFSSLDDQILAISRQQERLVLTNPNRPRLLNFDPDAPRPEALLAIALRHESLYYGSLWVAYDQPHPFSEEEVRFMATLAGQAALAAANARLFLNAEIGRQRLAAILASSPDPVLVTDQRDCLLLANPAAWQVLGLGAELDEGQPVEHAIREEKLLGLLHSQSDEKQSVEVSLPDGRVYLATATSVLAEGQQVGRVCVLRDVTHFKELDALKSDFVSTVSHDLRSPLTLMRGYATMLEMVGQLNEQQTSYVRKIVSGVESMGRLVNNLLDLGRIEAGIGLNLEMVPIQDVVERVTSGLQLQASQKKIQITTEISGQAAPLVEADQALLNQALQNLVENAIKYTRNDGKVAVRVQSRQERVIFEISDTGIGISPMDQPRLFEKFYRGAQQGSKEQKGTGLGLTIVKSIAERHGGKVWVESQLGKGSTFYFAIPQRQTRVTKMASKIAS